MRKSKYDIALRELARKPYFKAKEARDLGIPARMLSYFHQQGLLEKLGRGIYRSIESESGLDLNFEELVLAAINIPNSIICLISALCFYELTDQIMREYWIAIPNQQKSPKRPHTRVIRMRNMSLGQTSVKIGKFRVKIFDRERTIVDAFRYLSHEIAIKALQAYLKPTKNQKPDLEKLAKYAKILRVKITPYILALTT
ncbi:MAG: type IV toxin-antitoxin system AbiEi family antitoxin domain-containing protein [Chlamydiales bacterium]